MTSSTRPLLIWINWKSIVWCCSTKRLMRYQLPSTTTKRWCAQWITTRRTVRDCLSSKRRSSQRIWTIWFSSYRVNWSKFRQSSLVHYIQLVWTRWRMEPQIGARPTTVWCCGCSHMMHVRIRHRFPWISHRMDRSRQRGIGMKNWCKRRRCGLRCHPCRRKRQGLWNFIQGRRRRWCCREHPSQGRRIVSFVSVNDVHDTAASARVEWPVRSGSEIKSGITQYSDQLSVIWMYYNCWKFSCSQL